MGKDNKEPPVTNAATKDALQTGVRKDSSKKVLVKDADGNYKYATGVKRTETDLADPTGSKRKTAVTKGVSATQGDKVKILFLGFV